MKTKYALLSAILSIAVTLPLWGQGTHVDSAGTALKNSESIMLGKPTVDATVEGLHIKVWLLTPEQHTAMMEGEMGPVKARAGKQNDMGRMEIKGMNATSVVAGMDLKGIRQDGSRMKDTTVKKDKDVKGMTQGGGSMNRMAMDSMTAGTHHIRLEATDAASGKVIANAGARIRMVSPSGKKSSVDLNPMMDHFDGALTLDEKGEYRLTASVTAGGVTKTTQFQYAVK